MPPVRITSSGLSRRTVRAASSWEENIAVLKPAASKAAFSGTAVDRSSMVMRMRAGIGENKDGKTGRRKDGRTNPAGSRGGLLAARVRRGLEIALTPGG